PDLGSGIGEQVDDDAGVAVGGGGSVNVRGEGAVDAHHVEPVKDTANVREVRERRLAGGGGAVRRRHLIGGGEGCREPLAHRDPYIVRATAERHQGGSGQSSQQLCSHD